MRTHGRELTASVDHYPPAEIRNAFVRNLRKAIGPLAESTRAALAYCSPAGGQWIVTSRTCPCSQSPNGEIACLTGCHAQGRQVRTVALWYRNRGAGTVCICCDPAFPTIEGALCQAAIGALRQLELERENEALRADLSASREALQAVQDLHPRITPGQPAADTLDQVVARAALQNPGLRAVLWLVSGDRLEPRAYSNAPACGARPAQAGLLGKVIKSGEPLLAASRTDLLDHCPSEPELARATGVALVPVRSRDGVLGVLEVWGEESGAAFDVRLGQVLTALAFVAALALENEAAAQPSVNTQGLRQDMETAAQIQRTLLLGRPRMDLKVLRADALTIPSLQIGGDFYEFYPYDQVLDVVIGDVMGKGLPAALLGAATKNHLLRAINYLLAANPSRLPEPREILTIVNAEVFRQLAGMDSFVTLCYARFDLNRRVARFIDCGHTKTVHARVRSGTFDLLQGENMPIGFSRQDTYREFTVPLAAGDVFFFYSDGINEARRPSGEFYGEQRLGELVMALGKLDTKELAERVGADVLAFGEAKAPRDDVTCVAVKIQDFDATVASRRGILEIASDLREVPRAQAFLRDLCEQGLDLTTVADDLAELQKAVTETIMTLILHAYGGQAEGKIRIEANLFVNRYSVRLYHRGEPLEAGPGDAGDSGLQAVRQLVDQLQCSRSTHGEHCVALQKMLKH